MAVELRFPYARGRMERARSRFERALLQTVNDAVDDGLSPQEIGGALRRLGEDVSADRSPNSDPVFAGAQTRAPATRPTARPARNFVRYRERPEGGCVAIEVTTPDGLRDVEKQLEDRGLFLALVLGPAQGQLVDVCVMMPTVGAEVWFEGRVVFVSPSGTAIDLKPLESATVAAWAQAQHDFRAAVPPRAGTGRRGTVGDRWEATARVGARVAARGESGALLPRPSDVGARLRTASPTTHSGQPAVSGTDAVRGGFALRTHTRAARLRSQHAFDRLGVHWSACTTQILDAYRREVAPFLPENLPGDAAGLDDEIREVISRLREARDALRDQDCRRALRSALVSAEELQRAVQGYGDRGDLALVRGDLDAAVDAFRRVIELAPDNHAARAKLTLLTSAH